MTNTFFQKDKNGNMVPIDFEIKLKSEIDECDAFMNEKEYEDDSDETENLD